jgi:2-C-methyl-D-erythritol 2,4-cyclodiphosphate synthase
VSVGIGFDIHRLRKGLPLVLGGVRIPHSRGLEGHSDGDAVLHALIDALLGATGRGDIGEWFPPGQKRTRGIDSKRMLEEVRRKTFRGWAIENVDLNVIAEEPRLGTRKNRIRASVAKLLRIPASRVNIKAKTMEGLGEIGRGRAIAAQAVVQLRKSSGR